MKTLRYFLATSLLTLLLTITAFAGEMTTGITTPQPAPTPATAEGEMTTGDGGDIHTTNSDEATAGGAVAEAALSLLQGVLSLL